MPTATAVFVKLPAAESKQLSPAAGDRAAASAKRRTTMPAGSRLKQRLEKNGFLFL